MSTDTWNGGSGDWGVGTNWSLGSSPGALDGAVINSGDVTLTNVEDQDVASLTLSSASAFLDIQGELTVGDTHLNGVSNFLSTGPGVLTVDGGGLIAGGYLTSATGTVDLTNGGTYQWNGGQFVGGAVSTGQTVDMGHGANDTFQFSTQFDGTITDFNSGDTISYSGNVNSSNISGQTIVFDTNNGNYTLNFSNTVNMSDITISNNIVTTTQTVCFATGTLIRTVRGDIAVEALKIGDLAITASGEHRPIVWLGHRTLTFETSAGVHAASPIRILRGAFGDNLPASDLYLSPGHSICVRVVEDVFIPIGRLVNGATIAPVEVDEVTYWHVELASHDVLIANGLPAESYIDCDNRAWFDGVDSMIEPERAAVLAGYRLPFVDDGPIIEVVRAQLRKRAEALGWVITSDMDMRLVVDGRRVDADIDGGLARFLFPAAASNVQLVSETCAPAQVSDSGDTRNLGVSITGLHIGDGLRCDRDIPIDHPCLADGFHPGEKAAGLSWRWTNGRLRIPRELWVDCRSHVLLRIAFNPGATARWTPPARDAAETAAAPNVIALRVA